MAGKAAWGRVPGDVGGRKPSSVGPFTGGGARPISESLGGVLRSLGVPSKAVSRRIAEAWTAVADPAWAGRAKPLRLFGGVLVVGVSSAPLRLELAQFHAERLLAAMRARLPTDPITSLRFAPEATSDADEGRS